MTAAGFRDEAALPMPSAPRLRLAAATAAILLVASLVSPPRPGQPPKSAPIAITTEAKIGGRLPGPARRQPDAGFCQRCRAACAARRARCVAASEPGTRRRRCDGVEAACIIRCNDGLGCALPPPSLLGRAIRSTSN